MTRKPAAGSAGKTDVTARIQAGQGRLAVSWGLLFLGLALIQKIVVAVQLRAHPLTQPGVGLDSGAYADLAHQVIGGNWGLGPGLYYVSPLYIYFLAFWMRLTDSYTAVRLIQTLFGTAAIACIFLTAREWYGRRAAWIAGALAAFTGLFTFYEVLILQTSIDVFLTASALLCLTYALTRNDRRWLFAAGLIFGLQTLNRPQIALGIAGMALIMVMARRWRLATVLMLGLFAGIAPSAIRNVIVSHQFSLVSSHGGLNFYIGNRAGATGFYQLIPGITPNIKGQQIDARRVAEKALGRTLSDAETSDYFVDQSLQWMTSHPGDAALLMIRKFGWVFHAQHVALPYSYPFYQYDVPTWLRFYVVGPWLLMPLGLVGLAIAAIERRNRQFWMWAAFVPSYAAAVAAFFLSERYRLPLLVPMVVTTAGALDFFWRHTRSRQWQAIGVPLALAVILGIIINTRAIAQDGRWEEGLRMAQQLVVMGQNDQAEAWVARLEAKPPKPGMAHDGIGMQYLLNNQPDRALAHLKKAEELGGRNAVLQYSIGQALLGLNKPADALPYLAKSFEAGAVVPMAGYHLAAALEATGNAAGAAAIIPRITMTIDNTPEDWLRVGRLAVKAHAPADADPFFRQAVTMNPGSADARQQYGVNLVVLSRFDEAARELGEAVRLDPRNAASFSYLAYSEAKTGHLAEARQHLAAALALDASDPMAQQLAAVLR